MLSWKHLPPPLDVTWLHASGTPSICLAHSPLSSQAQSSFCDEVCKPPRYLYIKIGRASSSSKRYLSALLEVLVVESERPVWWFRSSAVCVVALMTFDSRNAMASGADDSDSHSLWTPLGLRMLAFAWSSNADHKKASA